MIINRFTKSYWIFTKVYLIFLPNHTGFKIIFFSYRMVYYGILLYIIVYYGILGYIMINDVDGANDRIDR